MVPKLKTSPGTFSNQFLVSTFSCYDPFIRVADSVSFNKSQDKSANVRMRELILMRKMTTNEQRRLYAYCSSCLLRSILWQNLRACIAFFCCKLLWKEGGAQRNVLSFQWGHASDTHFVKHAATATPKTKPCVRNLCRSMCFSTDATMLYDQLIFILCISASMFSVLKLATINVNEKLLSRSWPRAGDGLSPSRSSLVFLSSLVVKSDKCCSQKCAALRVQSVGVGWLNTWPVGNTAIAAFRAWVCVVWTGCGQRAMYTGSVHDAQARRACRLGNHGTCGPAWLSLLLSAAESFWWSQFLRNVFYWPLDNTLGLLHCRAVFPKDLEWTTPWGSLLQGCFQTQQGITRLKNRVNRQPGR